MGFFEIIIIAVVTLLVVGPERMPEAVRTVALTIGRIKRSFNSARDEIEKQIGADDIRRQLHNEEVMSSLEKIKGELSDIDAAIDSGQRPMPYTQDDYGNDSVNTSQVEESGVDDQIQEQQNQPAAKS